MNHDAGQQNDRNTGCQPAHSAPGRRESPIVRPTEIPFSLKGHTLVLVDDVLFTGRTIRAAMDALLDHGRPNRIWLAALVDRGGRQLPIQADFMALKLEVPLDQRVSVKVQEIDGVDGVFMEARA